MITRPDDDPEFGSDDPLAVILRPSAEHLGPPAGRYEEIRRGAMRRKLVRGAAGVIVACGVAAAVLLPLRSTTSEGPASPTVPLAPPPASSPAPSTPPPPPATATPEPVSPTASPSPSPGVPSTSPSMAPTDPDESMPTVETTLTERP